MKTDPQPASSRCSTQDRARTVIFAFYLFALCLACWNFLHGLSAVFHLSPWDESFYLVRGAYFPWKDLPVDFGPIYSVFFRFYRLFTSDPETIYFINCAFQPALLAILHFLLLCRLRVSCFISFLSAIYILVLGCNLTVVPKVDHFNCSCVYLVLIGLSFLSEARALVAYYFFSILLLVGIYVRQDNALASYGLLFVWGMLCLFSSGPGGMVSRAKVVALGLFGYFSLYATMLMALGTPFSASRTWTTFIDHFYDVQLVSGRSSADVPRDVLIERIFGDSHGILGALLHSPQQMLVHVGTNSVSFLNALLLDSLGHYPLTLWSSTVQEIVFFLGAFIGLVGFGLYRKRKRLGWRQFLSALKGLTWFQKFVLVVAVITCIKSTCIVLLLSPFPRYFLGMLCFLFVGLAFAMQGLLDFVTDSVPTVFCALILAAGMPNIRHSSPFYKELGSDEFTKITHFLRATPMPHPSPKLPSCLGEEAYAIYLWGVCNVFERFLDDKPSHLSSKTFSELVADEKPDIIVLDAAYRARLKIRGLSDSVNYFERNAESFGYFKMFELDADSAVYFLKESRT